MKKTVVVSVRMPDDLRDPSIPVPGRWFTSSYSEHTMPEWVFKHFGPAFLDQRSAYG